MRNVGIRAITHLLSRKFSLFKSGCDFKPNKNTHSQKTIGTHLLRHHCNSSSTNRNQLSPKSESNGDEPPAVVFPSSMCGHEYFVLRTLGKGPALWGITIFHENHKNNIANDRISAATAAQLITRSRREQSALTTNARIQKHTHRHTHMQSSLHSSLHMILINFYYMSLYVLNCIECCRFGSDSIRVILCLVCMSRTTLVRTQHHRRCATAAAGRQAAASAHTVCIIRSCIMHKMQERARLVLLAPDRRHERCVFVQPECVRVCLWDV